MSDVSLAIKDVGHGIQCAEASKTRLEVGEVALEHLKRAKDFSNQHGGRPLESSLIYGIVRQDAGFDFDMVLIKERTE